MTRQRPSGALSFEVEPPDKGILSTPAKSVKSRTKTIVTPEEGNEPIRIKRVKKEQSSTAKEVLSLTSKISGKYKPKVKQEYTADVKECSITGHRVLEPTKIDKRNSALVQQRTEAQVRDEIPLPPVPQQAPVQKPKTPQVIPCSYLVTAIDHLLRAEEELHPPILEFEPSMEAAERNYAKLQQRQFDLESILRTRDKSILSYGSEFKFLIRVGGAIVQAPTLESVKGAIGEWSQIPH